MLLSELKVGEKGRVTDLKGLDKSHRHQLSILGIKKDKLVQLKQVAPFGCPICVEIDGGILVLRKSECEGIVVEGL